MKPGYSVTVAKHGEPILTIERAMLSGQSDLSPEDADAIRECGEHLLSFIGRGEKQPCFVCGGVDDHEPGCPLPVDLHNSGS